jgi:hypothetical protein
VTQWRCHSQTMLRPRTGSIIPKKESCRAHGPSNPPLFAPILPQDKLRAPLLAQIRTYSATQNRETRP